MNTFFLALKPYLLSNYAKHVIQQFVNTLHNEVHLDILEATKVFQLSNLRRNGSLYLIFLNMSS